MVVSMGNLYVHGCEHGKPISAWLWAWLWLCGYDWETGVWSLLLSRKLDMETSSFPHLCVLDSQDWSPKTVYLYWCKARLFKSWRLIIIYSWNINLRTSLVLFCIDLTWLHDITHLWHQLAGYGCEYIILQYGKPMFGCEYGWLWLCGFDWETYIIQVYDRHPSVWLSRNLDMETSSIAHLCILVQKPVLMQDHRNAWSPNKVQNTLQLHVAS